MARKIVLAACAFLLAGSLFAYCQQSTEEKARQAELQIQKYTRQRNLGIGLCAGGAALEVVGAIIAYSAILNTDYYDPSYDSALLWGSVLMLASAMPLGFGTYLWISGAVGVHRWETRRFDLSLAVQGPDLASGSRLGGLLLVCRY
jgi:hypothetical protein